jgi:hemoglobin-like flavoprotein
MTTASLERIRDSFELLAPRIATMTATFYDTLFDGRPEIRALFKVKMDIQRQHLAAALALIVRNLTMLDALQEPLQQLGRDHARVGARPEHYPLVRDAMLHAIGQALGPAWTPELAADWHALIEEIGTVMLSGTLPRIPEGRSN